MYCESWIDKLEMLKCSGLMGTGNKHEMKVNYFLTQYKWQNNNHKISNTMNSPFSYVAIPTHSQFPTVHNFCRKTCPAASMVRVAYCIPLISTALSGTLFQIHVLILLPLQAQKLLHGKIEEIALHADSFTNSRSFFQFKGKVLH